MRMKYTKLLFGLLIFSLMFTGCSTTLNGSGPIVSKKKVSDGFRYHLSKDLLKVSVTKSVTTQKYIDDNLDVSPIPRVKTTISSPTITTINKRDLSASYTLDLTLRGLMDSNLVIEASDSGILKSVNGDSKGKAGQVIQNTLDIAASIAPLVQGLSTVDRSKIITRVQASSHMKVHPTVANLATPNGSEAFDAFIDNLKVLSNAELLMVIENANAFSLWLRSAEVKNAIFTAKNSILIARKNIAGLTDKVEIGKGFFLIEQYEEVLKQLSREKNELNTQWAATVATFSASKDLNSKTTSHTHEMVFELDQLPPIGTFSAGLDDAGMSTTLTGLSSSDYDKIKAFHKELGVVLEVTSPETKTTYPEITKSLTEDYKDKTLIFYRQKEPVVINAYAMKPTQASNGTISVVSQRIHNSVMDVIRPGPSRSFVVYDENVFGNHQLTLTFSGDNNGILTKLDRKTTSSIAASTSAISSGIKSAAKTLNSVSKEVIAYQANQRTMAQHDLQLQIDTLTNKKLVLDKRIALDAGTASEEDLKEKTRLDNALAALQSQYALDSYNATQEANLAAATSTSDLGALTAKLNLAKAQGSYEYALGKSTLDAQLLQLQSQLGMAQAQGNYDNNLATSNLQSQISLLSQQLTLDKAQQGYNTDLNTHLVTIQNSLQTLLDDQKGKSEVAEMQSQINLIKKEVELIQAKKELEEAKKNSP